MSAPKKLVGLTDEDLELLRAALGAYVDKMNGEVKVFGELAQADSPWLNPKAATAAQRYAFKQSGDASSLLARLVRELS